MQSLLQSWKQCFKLSAISQWTCDPV